MGKHFIKKLGLLFIAGAMLISSCQSSKREEKKEKEPKKDQLVKEVSFKTLERVSLSAEEIKAAEVLMAKIENRNMSGLIQVSGVLDVPPQNMQSISAVYGGYIKNFDLLQGMQVRKGQLLALIENPEFIQLQQDYLEIKAKLTYLEEEYKRQEELSRENAGAKKIFQQSASELAVQKVKLKGLEQKLMLIGIQPQFLTENNISRTAQILSPISGYVTKIHTKIGKYVNPNDELFEIVNTEHLHAELKIFEKDVSKIQLNQKVIFQLMNNEEKEYTAFVYLIGKEIDKDRSIRVHCHLGQENPDLIPGMFVKASLLLGEKNVPVLPENALIQADEQFYIFVLERKEKNKLHFLMLPVQTGMRHNGYVEVLLPPDFDLAGSEVVKQGAFSLFAKLRNTEE